MSIPLLILLAASSTSAAAHRVKSGTIEIDGTGDDLGWKEVAWSDGFVQYDPNEGAPPSERTRVKSAYDDDAVYFLVEAFDSQPDQIVGRLTRRDEVSTSDWIHVWLDTFGDGRSAYRFSVNPVDVKQDARVNDEVEDVNWDGIWDVRTTTSSVGWTAEFRIPFNQLRYNTEEGRWGFQVGRDLTRKSERSFFSSTPHGTTTLVRHFAQLEGLEALPSSSALSLEPYALGGVEVDDGDRSLKGTLGGEMRLGLGASMNLAVSINPDFGQVESDPSVLNLSSTEVFFDEKRSFFLEGKEQLDFPFGYGDGDLGRYRLFYTRRIGRAPTGGSSLTDDEEIEDAPANTPILGAVKLTGKTNDGWGIGLLDALTDGTEGTISGPDGLHQRTLEPLSNALVARVSKDFRNGQTTTGVILTHLVRRSEADTNSELVTQAVAGGADFSHRIGDYQLLARVFGSELAGTPAAIEEVQRSSVHYFQRPDAAHLTLDPDRESLAGWGTSIVAGKTNGKDWRGAAGVVVTSPGFDPNPLGYLPRADQQLGFLWAQYREDDPGPGYRNYVINVNLSGTKTFGNEITSVGGNVNATFTFPDTSYFYFGAGRDLEALSVNALFGGSGIERPGDWFGWIGGQTDDRAPVNFLGEVFGGYNDDRSGGYFGTYILLKMRPASSVEISLQPTVERDIRDFQWVDEIDDLSIVGHLRQLTASVALRANWTLTPDLSLQIYASPYLSAGRYENFRAVTDPHAARYRDRFSPYDYDGDDRFIFAQLRSNVVIRWEYLLGSTLYLVWSHEQSLDDDQHGTLDLGRDFSGLVTSPTLDTVLFKLSYWLAI